MTDGHKLFLTVEYSFDYDRSHFYHLAAFDCIAQFFEHRNNLEGYIDDEKGARIEEYSELSDFHDQMYWAFENRNIKGFVKDKLLEYEMYEVLAEYDKPLCSEALKIKKELEYGK